MRLVTILAAMLFALSAVTAPLYAQGRGNGQAKKPVASAAKATPRTPGSKATSRAQPTRTATKAETRAVKAEARAAKTETRAARTTAKTETRAAKANPNQEARLLTLLPAGTNIQDASQGFRNWGQFVAAVNVSNNQNIPFAELKARMTGIAPGSTVPTTAPMSLGQAIQSFKGTTTAPQP